MRIKNNINCLLFSLIFIQSNVSLAAEHDTLKEAINLYEEIDIIALGGIVRNEQVEQISKTKAYGFASIRYFI